METIKSFFNDSSLLSLSAGFLVAGFLGSWHCAVMCGPSACLLAESKQLKNYHFGRLIGYLLLGVFAGSVSKFLFVDNFNIPTIAVIATAALLLITFFMRKDSIFLIYKKLSFLRNLNSGLAIGLSSALLPCGWLYSFVAASLASKSALAGGFVMLLFWLTTLPSLSLAQLALRGLIQRSSEKDRQVARVVLLAASLFSLSQFLFFKHI